MLIVVVIIGILAAALIPRLTSVKDKADDSARKANIQQLVTAMASYAMDKDLTALPGAGDTSKTASLIAALTWGGMKTIPTDPQGTNVTIFGQSTTGFAFFLGSKWGIASGSFVFVSRAETPTAANFVECGGTEIYAGMNIDNLTPCSSVASSATVCAASTTGGACTFTGNAQLRIISKY